MVASYAAYESKTRINEKHPVAFALAGATPTGADPLKDFDESLGAVAQLPADFAKWLEQWAEQYAKCYREIKCSLLVVNPAADASRIVALSVEPENCRAVPDLTCILHPDRTNPAISGLNILGAKRNRPLTLPRESPRSRFSWVANSARKALAD